MKQLIAVCIVLIARAAGAHTLLPDPSITGGAAALPGYEATFALDESEATDYASNGLGVDTYLDFDLGANTLVTRIEYTDRRTSGGPQGTITDGTGDNVTSFDIIFSADATFGDSDDWSTSIDSTTCCSTDVIDIAGGAGLMVRYIRFDVTAAAGQNPGAAEFSFYTVDPPPGDANGQVILTSPAPYVTSGIHLLASPSRPDLSIRLGAPGSGFAVFQPADAAILRVREDGKVGIGTATPTTALHVEGDGLVTGTLSGGTIRAKYQDLAEWVPAAQDLSSGTVVIIDQSRPNTVRPSHGPYDTKVAGVVSARPGITLGRGVPGNEQVATAGRVRVKVEATTAPIQVGDLLVTSGREGRAMKSEPVLVAGIAFHQPGTILGRALEPLERGEGEILVLLCLQ